MRKPIVLIFPLLACLFSCGNNKVQTVKPLLTEFQKYVLSKNNDSGVLGEKKLLTIKYLYENGDEAAPSYVDKIRMGDSFVVESPFVSSSYSPSRPYVEGVITDEDQTIEVVYSQTSTWKGSPLTTWSGSGTEASPYIIDSAAKLAGLASNANSGETYDGVYFSLKYNINLNNIDWSPIGTSWTSSYTKPFKGFFNGNGHRVFGLKCENPAKETGGLFGAIAGSGWVKNLVIEGSVSANSRVGLCCASVNAATARIENIEVFGNVKSYGAASNTGYAGGVCGVNKGLIKNCVNHATVSNAYNNSGGIAGWLGTGANAAVEDSVNFGAVSATSGNFGGILGYANLASGKVANCKNYATISAKDCKSVGGIAGYFSAATMTDCANYGRINSFGQSQNVAGVIGYLLSEGTITKSSNYGYIDSAEFLSTGSDHGSYAGGIIGRSNKGHSDNCINYANVYGQGRYVGGCIGSAYTAGSTISFMTNYGNVTGTESVGGCVGYQTQDITDCINYGVVRGNLKVGGILGHNYAGRANRFTNEGKVFGSDRYIGGCVGHLTDKSSIYNSENKADVAGGTNVGGIIGYAGAGTAYSGCTNSGKITGTSSVGDIVGFQNT